MSYFLYLIYIYIFKCSLLHRAVSLSFKGLSDGLKHGLKTIRYDDNRIANLKKYSEILGERFPYARDGFDFYTIVNKFVSGFIDVYYETNEALFADEYIKKVYKTILDTNADDRKSGLPAYSRMTKSIFVTLLTDYVFTVTGMHHVVGNVGEYVIRPNFCSLKIRQHSELADIEAAHMAILLAVLTGSKAPFLMSDFEHLLLNDSHHNQTVAVFKQFQEDLKNFSEEIDRRNANRTVKFNGFDPRRMLSSVSI